MDGSDLTDDEWAQIEPLIPPAKRGGNNRTLREIANGLPMACGAAALAANGARSRKMARTTASISTQSR
jgi:transposase